MNIKYRHYITHLAVQTEVFPVSFKENCTIDWEDSDDEIFKRKVLHGKLKFINSPIDSISDYTYFKTIDDDSAERCDEINYELQRSCDNGSTYTNYWNGYFAVTDGEFDVDRCTFEVEPLPDDAYRCIKENEETEFRLSAVPAGVAPTVNFIPNYEYHTCRAIPGLCTASLPLPSATWLLFHTETIDGVTTSIYYREVAVVACEGGVAVSPSGSGWVQETVFSDNCTYGLSTWNRIPTGTPYTNNPNPYVRAGNCDTLGASSPPPHRKRLTVTKQNTTPTPLIIGKSAIALLGGPVVYSCDSEIYFVKDSPGSTYAWLITGAGNTIDSGNGTYKINVTLHAAGTISVIETSACGASSSASQAVTLTGGGSGSSTYNANVEMIGRLEVCSGSVGEYYLNASIGRTLNILGGTSTGTTISAGVTTNGITKYNITFGTAGSVTLTWSGGTSCDSSTVPVIGTINVVSLPHTPDIYGLTTVCKSGENKYFVTANNNVSSYSWVVTGGSITAGQGTNEVTVTWDGSAGTGYVYCYETIGCSCAWLKISDCGGIETEPSFYFCPPTDEVIYDKTKLYLNILEYFKDTYCTSIAQIVSDFFEWNPIGNTPGYSAGINYVTGADNMVSLIALVAKTQVLGLTNTKDLISWKKLTEILREVFQVYWFVDSSNRIRFEHISYFIRLVKFNLLVGYDSKAFYRNIFSYQTEKRPKYERFRLAEAINTDFIGAEIRYDSLCVNKDPKTNAQDHGVSYLSTDIQYINQDPTDVTKEGFVLLALDSGDLYFVASEAGKITGIVQPNAHLGWANLHYNYFRHYRVLLEGNMNLISETFLSVKRTKVQKGVKFFYCCGDDLDGQADLITTGIGNGSVNGASLNLKTNLLQTDLLFESDE